ncbi:MAG: hypothetical protein IPJ77_16790, partial [Planctomycetes bacterium]|nr:hypothetical protein [Planctomycetota bacterium]
MELLRIVAAALVVLGALASRTEAQGGASTPVRVGRVALLAPGRSPFLL